MQQEHAMTTPIQSGSFANTDLMPPPNDNPSWGSEGASSQDLLVPRISLAQDISDSVKKGQAKAGELIHSTTQEKLAPLGGSIEIIPISTYREWLISDVDEKGRDKYKCRIAMTQDNENWPQEGFEAGVKVRRVRCLNFFVMLPNKLDELPFLVSFKKTSMQAGKKLSTHFQVSTFKKLPPASQTFKLSATSRTWEGYTFFGFEVVPSRATTEKELAVARSWYDLFNKSQVKVEDEAGHDTQQVPF